MLYIIKSCIGINYSMNSNLYIVSDEALLVNVNGIFLGNAEKPLQFYTEAGSLLYFVVTPLSSDSLPYAFSVNTEENFSIPDEYGNVIALPNRRYELRLNAPALRKYMPDKLIKSITVKPPAAGKTKTAQTDSAKIFDFGINEKDGSKDDRDNNTDNLISSEKESLKYNNSLINLPALNTLNNNSHNNIPLQNETIFEIKTEEILPKTEQIKNNEQTNSVVNLYQKTPSKSKVKNYIVSVLANAFTQICIEYEGAAFYHILPDGLKNINLKAEMINNSLIAAVTAEKEKGQIDERYLLIIQGAKGNYEVKIDCFANQIEQQGKLILMLRLLGDIAGRGHITVYDSISFVKQEEYYVYAQGEPKKTADLKLMPVAVYQAVKCGDIHEAESYLTDSLKEILTPEKLAEFFAQYCDITPNYYYPQYPNSFFLIDSSNIATLFIAVFKNGKIDNFREIEFK